MKKDNIHQLGIIRQDIREGIFTMNGISRTRLIHSLIRDNGHYHDGSYSLDIGILSLADKRILLSHFVENDEYAWACESPAKTEAVMIDNNDYMQQCIDDECFTVYSEDMQEMGMNRNTCNGTGEVYWTRR